jgi:gliding motility-associated-like protein
MSEEKNFENLFKDSFEDFEAEVNPSVWKNVQTGLKGVGLGVLIKTAMNKLGTNAIVAIVSSAATVLSTVLVMNWNSSNKQIANNGNKVSPKATVESPAPEKVEDIKNFLADKKEDVKTPVAAEKNDKAELVEKPVTIKKDKKELESVINALSNQSVASINASTIGGSIPLVVNVTNAGNGKVNKWDFGNGQKDNGSNPFTVYDVPGIYTITLTSTGADGKTATDQIKVEVTGNSSMATATVQDSFSPNGDSVNDVFNFEGQNMAKVSVLLFDKKGNTLYTQSTLKGFWDGTDLKGKPVSEGEYYYILNSVGVDGRKYEKKGKITLTR